MNNSLEKIAEIRNNILLVKMAHKHNDQTAFDTNLQDIEDRLREIENEQVRNETNTYNNSPQFD